MFLNAPYKWRESCITDRSFGKNVNANVFEVHIVKLHVDENLLIGDGPRPHIDAVYAGVRWS